MTINIYNFEGMDPKKMAGFLDEAALFIEKAQCLEKEQTATLNRTAKKLFGQMAKGKQAEVIHALKNRLIELEEVRISIKDKNFEFVKSLYNQIFRAGKIEELELLNKTSVLWEAVSRKKGPLGGYIYTMKLKGEYHDLERMGRKSTEIFPALEASPLTIAFLYKEQFEEQLERIKVDQEKEISSYDEGVIELIDRMHGVAEKVLWDLGYDAQELGEGGYLLMLPDREALLAGWKKLKEARPELSLPPLKISNSQDIADDMEFVEAFFHFDVLLSEGKEFMHDQMIHVVSTLSRMLESTYKEDMRVAREVLREIYQKLFVFKNREKENRAPLKNEAKIIQLEAALGALTDLASSNGSSHQMREEVLLIKEQGFAASITPFFDKDSPFGDYFSKRFGKELLTIEEMKELVTAIDGVVA